MTVISAAQSNCRKELIAQYSCLSEEAARRERRAMWRVQRMKLDEDRAQFLNHDRQHIQVCDEMIVEEQTRMERLAQLRRLFC